MSRPVIEFPNGTSVDVMYWYGPGYQVQWVRHRVCNEDWIDGKHWVKVEVGYEDEGPDPNGENKFWVRREYVRTPDMAHSLRSGVPVSRDTERDFNQAAWHMRLPMDDPGLMALLAGWTEVVALGYGGWFDE